MMDVYDERYFLAKNWKKFSKRNREMATQVDWSVHVIGLGPHSGLSLQVITCQLNPELNPNACFR